MTRVDVLSSCALLSATRLFQTVSGKIFCNIYYTFIAELLSVIEEEGNNIPEKAELNKALDELERNGIDPEGYLVLLSR